MRIRLAAKYLGGVLLAALLLLWVLWGQDPRAIWAGLQGASVWGLLLGAALNFGQNVPRVWRWRWLLHPIRAGVPFRPMFDSVVLGYMATWILPFRVGEFVRPALLSSRQRIPLGPCMGSIVADRLLDAFMVLVLFVIGAAVTPLQGAAAGTIRAWAPGLAGVLAVCLLVLMVASRARSRLERWIERRGRRLAWVGRFLLGLLHGLDAFKYPRLILPVMLHTALTWLMIALGTWVCIRSCGADVGFGAVLFILPVLVLGIAVPTPGGAGSYHFTMTFGLHEILGVPEPLAVGTAFLTHLAVILPVIAGGSLLMMVDRIPLRELLQATREVRHLGASGQPLSAQDAGGEVT